MLPIELSFAISKEKEKSVLKHTSIHIHTQIQSHTYTAKHMQPAISAYITTYLGTDVETYGPKVLSTVVVLLSLGMCKYANKPK